MRVLLDWSLLANRLWHRMSSPNYKAVSDLELEEFARNMAMEAYKYKCRFNPTDYIFAMDAPEYWRNSWYEAYYKKYTKFWKNLEEVRTWMVAADRIYYRCSYHTPTDTWRYKKLNAKEVTAFKISQQDKNLWMYFEEGKTPEHILKAYPETPATIQDTQDWEGLKTIIPKYKGNRSDSNWKFNTKREEFKEYLKILGENLAPVVGARVLEVPWAEADDIGAIYAKHTTEHTVLVSGDHDWPQMLLTNPLNMLWDPMKSSWIPPKREAIILKLLCQIIGGDDSDKIKGVLLNGKNPCSIVTWKADGTTVKSGKSTLNMARKLMDECGGDFGKIHTTLLNNEEKQSYTKNVNLISFLSLPSQIENDIIRAIKETEVQPVREKCPNLSDFCVDSRTEKEVEMNASHLIELDKQIDFNDTEALKELNEKYVDR